MVLPSRQDRLIFVYVPSERGLNDDEMFQELRRDVPDTRIYIWKFRIEGIMANDHGRNSVAQAVYKTQTWQVRQYSQPNDYGGLRNAWQKVRFEGEVDIPHLFSPSGSRSYRLSDTTGARLSALIKSAY